MPYLQGSICPHYKIRIWRRIFLERTGILKLGLIITGILFFLNTFTSLAPVSSMDALNYHFDLPKLYLARGRDFPYEGESFRAFSPAFRNAEPFCHGVKDQTYQRGIKFIFCLALCTPDLLSCLKIVWQKVALISALFFYCMPIITWEATGSFVELPWTYFLLLALYMTERHFSTDRKLYIFLSGIFMGFAFSIKSLTVAAFLITVLVIIYVSIRQKSNILGLCRNLSLWIFAVILSGSAWNIR